MIFISLRPGAPECRARTVETLIVVHAIADQPAILLYAKSDLVEGQSISVGDHRLTIYQAAG
jgi:hypothetical protein